MSKYSWQNDNMQICSECHYKDSDPDICHAVEPPIVKQFIPSDVSSCAFIRESYWNRIQKSQKEEIEEDRIKRSKRYYKK